MELERSGKLGKAMLPGGGGVSCLFNWPELLTGLFWDVRLDDLDEELQTEPRLRRCR